MVVPRIFDNIQQRLLPALRGTLADSARADFCVGYFNLRGWRELDDLIEDWSGADGACCRLLVGMQRGPQEELRLARGFSGADELMDQQTAAQLKRKVAHDFREQLVIGAPTNADEAGLRRLSAQLRAHKLVVKVHLRYPLHAKLYLAHKAHDHDNPSTAYLGSSNLTLAGLATQGELNVDVLDHDACEKLRVWFEARWADRLCWDISTELADIIDESWARPEPIPPWHIYLKMAYHLSQDAREGLAEFTIPPEFRGVLLPFQEAAVRIAAQLLKKHDGVMLGDVVGLGKTIMATALAKIFENDSGVSTLIICPANLKTMWRDYADQYGLHNRILSYNDIEQQLGDVPGRFRQIILDESHNLRNPEGQRYKLLREHIEQTGSRVIMLTATPYNKTYGDLGAQLRLFVPEHEDLGIRPERYIESIGELTFQQRHQAPLRSLAAFEHSPFADDWRDLMRRYLVRRTRAFIQNQATYTSTDSATGRKYLTFADGRRSYFAARLPRTLTFPVGDGVGGDPYARLFSPAVVEVINELRLPRYGLGNYAQPNVVSRPTPAEQQQLDDLSRAGQRLMGFMRTNLFKRLESAGPAFIQSVDRHILRNFVTLHAIEQGLPLPLGTQDPELLDPGHSDVDPVTEDEDGLNPLEEAAPELAGAADYRRRAAAVYAQYAERYKRRFKWLRPTLFAPQLAAHLLADARALLGVLNDAGPWEPARDSKLAALEELLSVRHAREKVLIFTQFADTVDYLVRELRERGVAALAGATGDSANPAELAQRFSPVSNGRRARVAAADELRVLVATDVLSEGQNLQDCRIVVNYDLPWAIIRLIQRAGRVDRIGQEATEILCYTFLPADGVEQLLNLRARVVRRLRENDEVVGGDEAFFEDGEALLAVRDLYTEQAHVYDDASESDDTDLTSRAWEIWQQATRHDAALKALVEGMPDVVYSAKQHTPAAGAPEGVLVYARTAQGNDALAWLDQSGRVVSQSQLRVLDAAACRPSTPALPRDERHHAAVERGVRELLSETDSVGGQLGRPSGARYKTYARLKRHEEETRGTLFNTEALKRAIDDIYRYPLRERARETLNRQLRAGIDDQRLAELVIDLREADQLSIVHDEDDDASREPRIICSLGLTRG